jgi:hypothetical protein
MLLCSTASASELKAPDVRQLLASAGFNPGTVRMINDKRHQLMRVTVKGSHGHWTVTLDEKELPDAMVDSGK